MYVELGNYISSISYKIKHFIARQFLLLCTLKKNFFQANGSSYFSDCLSGHQWFLMILAQSLPVPGEEQVHHTCSQQITSSSESILQLLCAHSLKVNREQSSPYNQHNYHNHSGDDCLVHARASTVF